MRGVRWGLAALALVALAACGDGESNSGGTLAGLGVKDGASRGVSKSAELTPDKGVSLELSTGAALQVPKGAVDKATTVSIERPTDTKAVDLVQRFKSDQDRIVSAPYVLKPHGTKFSEEVTVTLPLSKAGTRDEVEVAWLEDEDDTEWKKLGVAKSDGKSAQITLKHFSVLVVVEDASDLRVVDEPEQPDAAAAEGGAASPDAGTDLDAGLDSGDPRPVDTGVIADVTGEMDVVTPDASAALDAGLGDASAQLDGGLQQDALVPVEPDASDSLPDTGSGDAGIGDAFVPPDASVDPRNFAQNFYAKLQSCGHVTQAGGYSLTFGADSIQQCEFNCYANGTCEDAMAAYCSFPIGDAGGFSPGIVACFNACRSFVCPDAGTATRCNGGEPECANGEDERYCTGTFTCGAEIVGYGSRCNMYVDCLDGSDEQGCFSCDAGVVLPPEAVCDGVRNCSDGTDEPASCAKVALACGTATL